jgi:hypothetical protein
MASFIVERETWRMTASSHVVRCCIDFFEPRTGSDDSGFREGPIGGCGGCLLQPRRCFSRSPSGLSAAPRRLNAGRVHHSPVELDGD